MNLSDVWVETDADDASVWAAQHEMVLRRRTYDFYSRGGIAGVFRRAAESVDRFARIFTGWPAHFPERDWDES